jgi:hypothetical protein
VLDIKEFLPENMAKKNKINCDAILINRLINKD